MQLMNLSIGAWLLIVVPVIIGVVVMLLYGFWDKITGKEYFVNDEILAYDKEMLKEEKEGGVEK